MKLKKTPIALALAGGLLMSGATLATPEMMSGSEPVLITYEVYEPVIVQESGWISAPSGPEPMARYFIVEPAPQVETWTYYVVPGTRDSQMPNPTPPSQTNSWGG